MALAFGWRRPLLVAAPVALVAVAAILWFSATRPGPDGNSAMDIGGPFTLEDGGGHTVTERDLRGHFALIYFGYTFCPDVCPTTLNDMAAALDKLGADAAKVQPVFISIDPQRDTPKLVHDYVAAFSPRLIGLTGTPEQVAAVARAYRVYYAQHRTGPGPLDYTMDHSSLLYLMGPDGAFVAPIRADEPPEAMAADIKRHLS